MPQIPGPELSGRLEELRPEMKTLYVSGYPNSVIAHHGVLKPGVALLSKPFTPTTLAHKVRQTLDNPS
jgi:FixJ family two-component response regulator